MNLPASLRLRAYLALAVALASSSLAAPVFAHTKERAMREIVRVRGTAIGSDAECARGAVTVRVLNRAVRLCAAEVRRIAVATAETAETEPPAVFELQGERERLAALTGAPEGARVVILGEWRPGRKDLFLIEIDVCACANEASSEATGRE